MAAFVAFKNLVPTLAAELLQIIDDIFHLVAVKSLEG